MDAAEEDEAVNHPGAGGTKYTSAPPKNTLSADTARNGRVCAVMLRHHAGTSKRPREEDTSNGDPQHKEKRVKTSSFVATKKAPAAQKQQRNTNALPVGKAPAAQKQQRNTNALPVRTHFSEVSTPFLPIPSISFDLNSLVLKPTTNVNAARRQGTPVAGALDVRNAAEEDRSTVSSHLVSVATTAGSPSLTPLGTAVTISPSASTTTPTLVPSAATTSLAPSASISNKLGAPQPQDKGAWTLSWYTCHHSEAIISRSRSLFRQKMLLANPFNTSDLDAISLQSYQSAVSEFKGVVEKANQLTGHNVDIVEMHRKAMQATRGAVKTKARPIVWAKYLEPPAGLANRKKDAFIRNRVETVLTHKQDGYMWGTLDSAKNSEKSYYGGHPALAQVIADAFFNTQNAEGVANFDAGWNPIPDSVIGLAGAAICCALKEYETGTRIDVRFTSQYVSEYDEIMKNLRKLETTMPRKYLNMKTHLTKRVVEYSKAFSVAQTPPSDNESIDPWGLDSVDDPID